MRKFFFALTLLVASASSAFAQWGRPVDYAAGPGLKDAYKDFFTIGVAVNKTNVSDPAQMEIIKKQFNSVTAENAWKPGEIHPEEGVWNFSLADSIANFCRENGIKTSPTSVVRTASRCVVTASAGTLSLPTGCSPTRKARM